MEKSDNTAVLVFGVIAVLLIIATTDYFLFSAVRKISQNSPPAVPVNVTFSASLPPAPAPVIMAAPASAPAPDNGTTPLDCNNVTNLSDAMQCANIGF